MRTSGLAVAFSGVTVIIALAGLFLIDSKTAHSMAIGAIVVVGVAVLAAVTLLPALIDTLGRRAYEPGKVIGKVVAKLTPKPKPEAVPFWTRWTNRLMNRPVLYATLATALMLLIAAPALSMKLGTGAIAQLPKDFETAKGNTLATMPPDQGGVGPGGGGPVQVVADFGNGPVDAAKVQQFTAAVKQLPGVAAVGEPVTSSDGHLALIEVISKTNPEDDATYALVERIRSRARPRCSAARTSTSAAPRRRTTTSPT